MSDDRGDWLRWRRGGIGASDAAAICGLSRWGNPYTVWLDKTGQLPLGNKEETSAQRWGSLLEPAVIAEFERQTNYVVHDRQVAVAHPDRSWQRATLDGRVYDVDELVLGLYEGKTSNGLDGTWRDGVPGYYQLQAQHQMAVDDRERVWIAVLLGGQAFEVHELTRDHKAIEILTQMEYDFWHTNVLGRIAPAIDGSSKTTEALRVMFAKATPQKAVDLPLDAAALITERERCRKEQKEWEAKAQLAENELLSLMGDAEVGLLGGERVVLWKEVKSQRLDQSALGAEHPELVKRFMKESSYRRLTITGRGWE